MHKAAKTVVLLLAMLTTSGCVTKYVYVPVSSCTEPRAFNAPYLMVDNLPVDATTKDKLQALKVDHGTMKSSISECKALLDGYRKPAPKPQKEKTGE